MAIGIRDDLFGLDKADPLFKTDKEAMEDDVLPILGKRSRDPLSATLPAPGPLPSMEVPEAPVVATVASASPKLVGLDDFLGVRSKAQPSQPKQQDGMVTLDQFLGVKPAKIDEPKKDPGLDIGGSVAKGFKGLAVTWDFLANKLEKAVTGKDTDTRDILLKSAQEYQQLESDPRIAEMVQKGNEAPDTFSAVKDMLSFALRNPSMIANFAAEQVPGAVVGGGIGAIATAPLKSAAVGLATKAGASAGVSSAIGTGVAGAGFNTGTVVFQSLGSNFVEGLQKYDGDQEAASEYAVTKTAAEVPANAVAGAFLGLAPFKSKIANLTTQATIQGAGGAAGAASAAASVGEDIGRGELILEFLGEFVTSPIDIIAAGRKSGEAEESIRDRILREAQKDMSSDETRQRLFDRYMDTDRGAQLLSEAGITSPDDPEFQTFVNRSLAEAIGQNKLLESIPQPPTAEQRQQVTKERGEDVRAAFGDTASTAVGVATGATEPVIRRDSVVPDEEQKQLVPVGGADSPKPAILPEGKSTPAGTVALAPEDIVSRQQGFEVMPAMQVGEATVGNRFFSNAQAETFLFGPVNKETGKREGGYAASVPDMEFQIRRGQRSKEAGGGSFYFIEGRERPAQPAAGANPSPAPAPAAPAAPSPSPAPAPAPSPAPAPAPAPVPAPAPAAPAPSPAPAAAPTPAAPVTPPSDPYEAGRFAFSQKQAISANPFEKGTEAHNLFNDGFLDAMEPDSKSAKATASANAEFTSGAKAATVAPGATASSAPATPAPPPPKETVEQKLKKKNKQKKAEAAKTEVKSEPPKTETKTEPPKTETKTEPPKTETTAQETKPTNAERVKQAIEQGQIKLAGQKWGQYAPQGVKFDSLTPESKKRWADAVNEGKPNMALAEELSGKATKPEQTTDAKSGKSTDAPTDASVDESVSNKKIANKASTEQKPAESKPSAADQEAIELWEDNDDGVTHIPWAQLERSRQREWIDAVADRVATIPLHDQIVNSQRKSERAERINNRASKKPDDGALLRRRDDPGRKRMTVDAVVSVYDRLTSSWAKTPNVKVVQSESDLPKSQLQKIQRAGAQGQVPGLFVPSENTVYLVADNITSAADAIVTIAHETTGHFGLRRLLGDSYAKTMNDIYNGNKTVRDKADAMIKKEGLSREVAVEEVLADMAEENARLALEGKAIPQENRNALQRIFAAIRKWLRSVGVAYVSDSDVRQIVLNARRYVVDGDIEAGSGDAAFDTVMRREGVAPLYSALERAFVNPKISLDKNGAAPAAQWRSWLESKKGELRIKKQEIEWSGINEYLDLAGNERLTAQQIKDWVAANRIYVNDVILSDLNELELGSVNTPEPTTTDLQVFIEEKQGNAREEGREEDDFDGFFDDPYSMTNPQARQWIAENYGWQNFLNEYRKKMLRFDAERLNAEVKPKHAKGKLVLEGGKNHTEIVLFSPKIDPYAEADDVHYGRLTKGLAIGWLRLNERTDTSGNTVLFIEESQSKRAQDGRKKGFVERSEITPSMRELIDIERRQMFLEEQLTDEYWDEGTNSAEDKAARKARDADPRSKELDELGAKVESIRNSMSKQELRTYKRIDWDKEELGRTDRPVPDAPFMDDTRSWTSLLIKRAVAYAQSRGIDRVAWTRGEQQNERYKVSDRFDRVEVNRIGSKGDSFDFIGTKGGKRVVRQSVKGEKGLTEILGSEELARQAMEQGGLTLEGDALKQMDVDLAPYYDQVIPSVAKDLLKSFGGKVEVMEIRGTGQHLGFVIPESLQKTVEEDGLPLFRRKDYEAQYDGLPEDTRNRAIAKGHYSPPTIKDRLASLRPQLWTRVVQGMFDPFRPILDLNDRAYKIARLSTTTDGALEGAVQFGHVFLNDGALDGKAGTKGLIESMQPLGKEVDRFLIWVAANRAEGLKKDEREKFFSDDDIRALKKLNLGQMPDGKSRATVYANVLRDMNDLNKSVLQVAKDAGLIDDAAFKRFSQDIWYVPFYRVMEDGGDLGAAQNSSGLVGQYLSKQLKGSERPLQDLMQNTLLNWSHILTASMKNLAANETLDAAVEQGGIVTKLERQERGAVKTMVDGKETWWRVEDPLLFNALESVATYGGTDLFIKIFRPFKTTLTRFVSLSPSFKLNNLIRDSVQSIALTELEKNPVTNVIQGVAAYKDRRMNALFGGGIFSLGNAFDGDMTANVKRLVKSGVKEDTILTTVDQAKAVLRAGMDKYDAVSDALENANRLALYEQMRANGASHLDASYAARDLQDFSLQGAWRISRYAANVLPYYNARMQGLYKIGRDGLMPTIQTIMGTADDGQRKKAARFGAVLGSVTLVTLALYLAYKDDEDFKRREDFDRDNFWWFKVGDKAFRIPKPFELGAFASLMERALEQIVDQSVEGKVFGKRLLAILADNLAINPMPQAGRPLYDIGRNEDGFTGRPIESLGLQGLSAENRVSMGTSALGKGLGNANALLASGIEAVTGGAIDKRNLKLSPIQYDYLIRGYLGWVGSAALTTSNWLMRPMRDSEAPNMRIDDMFVIGNYVKQLPAAQSRYLTDFYESSRKIAEVMGDYNQAVKLGNVQAAADVARSNKDLMKLNSVYQQVSGYISDINNKMKLVEDSKTLDGEAKRIELDRLSQLKGRLAQRAEEIRINTQRRKD